MKNIGSFVVTYFFLVVFNACGASSESPNGDQYIAHTYESRQAYKDADALGESQRGADEERELTDTEKVTFRLFVSDYANSISGILESYYLYRVSEQELLYIQYAITSDFEGYQRAMYQPILNSKLIELQYLLEVAQSSDISDSDIVRIENVVFRHIRYENGECPEPLAQICLLISI